MEIKLGIKTTTLIIENKYGRLCAYPADVATAHLVRLKDRGASKAKTFDAKDMRRLRAGLAEYGVSLVEDLSRLHDNDKARWEAQKEAP